jgi:hypothetical protein
MRFIHLQEYNKCHDAQGQFCAGPGGGGSRTDQVNAHIETLLAQVKPPQREGLRRVMSMYTGEIYRRGQKVGEQPLEQTKARLDKVLTDFMANRIAVARHAKGLRTNIARGVPNYTPEGGTDPTLANLHANVLGVLSRARTRWIDPKDAVPAVAQDLIAHIGWSTRKGGDIDTAAHLGKTLRTTRVEMANLHIDIAPIPGTKHIALDITPLNATGKVRRFILKPENNYFISDQRVYDTIKRLDRIGAKFKAKTLKARDTSGWRGV